MENQVHINNDARIILVSDMPIMPVGYSLVKSYPTWDLAISFAYNLNFPLHYEIQYDNEYTRNGHDMYFLDDDSDDSDNNFESCSNCPNPDICRDYYCEIKAGVREDSIL